MEEREEGRRASLGFSGPSASAEKPRLGPERGTVKSQVVCKPGQAAPSLPPWPQCVGAWPGCWNSSARRTGQHLGPSIVTPRRPEGKTDREEPGSQEWGDRVRPWGPYTPTSLSFVKVVAATAGPEGAQTHCACTVLVALLSQVQEIVFGFVSLAWGMELGVLVLSCTPSPFYSVLEMRSYQVSKLARLGLNLGSFCLSLLSTGLSGESA